MLARGPHNILAERPCGRTNWKQPKRTPQRERYLGLDDHVKSRSFALLSEQGKKRQSMVVKTNDEALVGFIKTIPGCIHLCLEEGCPSSWLYEILSPYADEIVNHVPPPEGAV
jgi:hypothetical protein